MAPREGALPTGTVTFLFTDIEGSTKLLQELGDGYAAIQDDHMRLMREAIAAGGGRELRTEGDAFFAVFPSAAGAVRAAVAAQRSFDAHPWPHGRPFRVRMGMHTGEGRLGGDDYLGIDVNRAARIAAAGHGGQVLLSEATTVLVEGELPAGVTLRGLGRHRLKDFDQPQPIHQLVIEGLPSEFPPIRTLEIPSNLPSQPTSFLGRERELGDLRRLADAHALVTLTGPGGTGKTRLAIEAARQLLERFPDGVVFVDLSAIGDPALVASSIAEAAGVREEPPRPILETLKDELRDREMLLVLDNFEQVLGAATTVGELLATAPSLRALTTSRRPLHLRGEHEYPVPPLPLPGPRQRRSPDALSGVPAVALFVQRAAAVQPGFVLTEANADAVADICTRLDGLPLAIELAASRIKVLSPEALRQRLERRLPLLTGGARDFPDRQRTLRSAIEWSYDLLDRAHRILFHRLAVFSGGWSLDAAEAVAASDADIGVDLLDGVAVLVDDSLVLRETGDGADPRFRMLETIREFGVERLDEAGEADEARGRHARWFLKLAEEAGSRWQSGDQRWADPLIREHDNLRAALAWAIDGDRGEIAASLVSVLWYFWRLRGHIEEGRRWADRVIALRSTGERTSLRARALTALGGIAYWQNDFDTAIPAYEEALQIHRDLGDREATVQALFDLGTTRGVTGDLPGAQALLEESLVTARDVGDRRGEAWALWGLGSAAYFGGDAQLSRSHLEESLRLFEDLGDVWGLGNVVAGLAGLALQAGEFDQARAHVFRTMDLWEGEPSPLNAAMQVNILAIVANALGKHERAARLAGAAAAFRERAGGRAPEAFTSAFPEPGAAAAEALDEETFQKAWHEGQAMALEEALAYAREEE